MYKLIVSLVRLEKLDTLTSALRKERIAFTYSKVKGFCGEVHLYQEDMHERIRFEIISEEKNVEKVKDIIMDNACCGLEGDGCMSIYVVEEFVRFS
jgi:nitrogen regulatory protein PII